MIISQLVACRTSRSAC